MDTDELFSFLEEQNGGLEASASGSGSGSKMDIDPSMNSDFAGSSTTNRPKKKRRKGTSNVDGSETPTIDTGENGEEKGTLQNKKARTEGPSLPGPTAQPIVLDEFETEQKREVNASAGLTGQVDDSQRLELRHQVRHQVAIPPSYPYKPLHEHIPDPTPARTYPFDLDPFQRLSIHCIQRNESVLVSAHTSAGKTVVAEYAIAQCLRDKQRIIYTSPIKALSNQKYRDMLERFGDVGLMTGDVTINPSASCLVMTTEILRSMLYRGSEVVREVAWVIFDEIHYMRDTERGVVWEETIILLPHSVRHAFLSATIPNAYQFASWITKSHNQPCHVIYTDFRPTPLHHYLFPAGGEGIYLVVNEKSEFREDNFVKAMGSLAEGRGEDPADVNSGKGRKGKTRKGGNDKGSKSDINKIIKMIMLKNYNPVIVFAFSKRDCEYLALQVSKTEFNNPDEQSLVARIFENAIMSLSSDDQALPQIAHLQPLLKRGIGIHHGGLLPIMKECIEILFQEGLIKVLFATETFSIGLNMPAKTVIFTSVRKFDGHQFRTLSSGEYIQMSGRAGRRGLDDRGIVILMVDEKLEPATAKEMIKGEADRLNSAFHLGYNMVLNLMKVEGISPEYMLEKCFFQYQSEENLPVVEQQLREAEQKRDSMIIPDEEKISEYFDIRSQLTDLRSDFREVITHPSYSLPFLQVGRLVKVRYKEHDFGWGVVVNYQKRSVPKNKREPVPELTTPHSQYIVDVLLDIVSSSTSLPRDRSSLTTPLPPGVLPITSPSQKSEPAVVPVLLDTIEEISHLRLHIPSDLRPLAQREVVSKSIAEVKRRFPKGIGLLDPVENMGIKDVKFKKLIAKIAALEEKLFSSPLHKDPRLPQLYTQYQTKHDLLTHIRSLRRKVQESHDILQLEELKSRKRVLRRLGFTTSEDIVDVKGRVACEISTGDELLLTELIFNGVFNPLPPEHCAALLSCFVFDEKSETAVRLKEALAAPLRTLQEIARRIAQVSKESKLPIEEDAYVASFKVELMDVVVQWCKGASFSDVCKLTDAFEGSLIRVFRRLGELLRQMTQAAKVIGNNELEEKFKKSSEMLERPNSVIFCSSLYL